MVQALGDQFLACATLADHKNGTIQRCGAAGPLNRVEKGQALTDELIGPLHAPTIGAEAHMPFGGVKETGNGHREGGWEVYEFYSETKVGYVDYSGALQRAQIDNY